MTPRTRQTPPPVSTGERVNECLDLQPPADFPEWAWVGLCFIAGWWIRFSNVSGRPLWTDEFTTLITAKRGFFESFFTQQDPQPPLYQLMLRFLLFFTDNPSEWLVRFPALICGCLCVLAGWWFARTLFGPLLGGLTALGIAINPMMIYYSREARPYSLFTLAAILSMTFFYQMIRSGKFSRVIGYAVATGVMFHSHYYAIFCIAAQLVYLGTDLILDRSSRAHLKNIGVGLVGAVVLSLPAELLFLRLLGQGMPGAWWISRPSPIESVDTLGDLLGLRMVGVLCLLPLISCFWLTRSPYDWTDPTGGGLAGAGTDATSRSWWMRRQSAVYAGLWVVFGLFIPVVGSILYKPGFVMRYALPVMIPMLALGLCYARRLNPTIFVLTVVMLFGYNLTKIDSQTATHPGMRDLVKDLQNAVPPGDHLAVMDWSFADDFIHPEIFGMRYYGLEETAVTKIETIDIDQVEAGLLGKRSGPPLLRRDRSYEIVCFGSTVKPMVQYLTQAGRAFEAKEYGTRTLTYDTLKLIRVRAEPPAVIVTPPAIPPHPEKTPEKPLIKPSSKGITNLTPDMTPDTTPKVTPKDTPTPKSDPIKKSPDSQPVDKPQDPPSNDPGTESDLETGVLIPQTQPSNKPKPDDPPKKSDTPPTGSDSPSQTPSTQPHDGRDTGR